MGVSESVDTLLFAKILNPVDSVGPLESSDANCYASARKIIRSRDECLLSIAKTRHWIDNEYRFTKTQNLGRF